VTGIQVQTELADKLMDLTGSPPGQISVFL
jgi:hypothetical protein